MQIRNFLGLVSICAVIVDCGPPPPPQYGRPEISNRPHPMDSMDMSRNGVGSGGGEMSAGGTSLEYLTAQGHGPTEQQCDGDARAALAKIFEVRIRQESNDWQAHFSTVSSLGVTNVESMSVDQLTRASTDKVLIGTQVTQQGPDPAGGVRCVAMIPRGPTEARIRSDIERLDGEIRGYLSQGDGAATDTDKFLAYKSAMQAMQRREALNVELSIVSSRGSRMAPPTDWGALVAKFTVAKGRAKIGLQIQGTEASKIQTCMAAELAKNNITVLENTSDVDLMVQGTLKYQKAGWVMGSEMVRADVNLRVMDVEGGKTLSAFTDYVKVGRPELQQSVQLAVSRLCLQAVPKLAQQVQAAMKR